MKRISRFLLLSIFLASCADAVTPMPVLTETSAPTATLALTDTPQPTPTETPDPDRPAGTFGKDAQGEYVDVNENGHTVRYRYETIVDDRGNEIYTGWFASHVENGSMNGGESIAMRRITDKGEVLAITMPLSVDVSSSIGLSVPMFIEKRPIDSTKITLGASIGSLLVKNDENIKRELSPTDLSFAAINKDPVDGSITFKIGDKIYKWTWYLGCDVHLASIGELAQLGDYWTTTDENVAGVKPDQLVKYYWRASTVDNKLVIFAAVDNPAQLNTRQIFEWVLHPMGMVITKSDLSGTNDYWDFSSVPSDLIHTLLDPNASIIELNPSRPTGMP